MGIDDILKDGLKVEATFDQVSMALTVLSGIAKLFFELKEKADRDGVVTKDQILQAIDSLNARQAKAMEKVRQEIESREELNNVNS